MAMVGRLDRHFPELGMADSYVAPLIPWQDAAESWTDDVASILMPHDDAVVGSLTTLVPEYNPDLAKGDIGSALDSLARLAPGPEALRVFFRYMVACGHIAAAEATRDAIRAAARAAKRAARGG
jgi:hypothetical protein